MQRKSKQNLASGSKDHGSWKSLGPVLLYFAAAQNHSSIVYFMRDASSSLPKTMKINLQFIIFNLNFLHDVVVVVGGGGDGGSGCRVFWYCWWFDVVGRKAKCQTTHFAAKWSSSQKLVSRNFVQFSVINSTILIIALTENHRRTSPLKCRS